MKKRIRIHRLLKKRSLLLLAALLFVSVVPASAATGQAQKSKPFGKHNFEQWQTIKRLQINSELPR